MDNLTGKPIELFPTHACGSINTLAEIGFKNYELEQH
jgi:hypothetical protein